MAKDGALILLLANTGTEGSPVYTAVAEQTGADLAESNGLIDASSKDSGHTKWLYGLSDGSVSLSALYVNGDAGVVALRAAMRTKVSILVRRSEDGSQVEQARFLVRSLGKNHPNAANSTWTIEMQANEDWAAV